MWPGSSPSAVVNGAAGMIIAALVVVALYAGRDLFMPLALAGLLGFVLARAESARNDRTSRRAFLGSPAGSILATSVARLVPGIRVE
jgi:predicted PurR-regulated permease PerM